MSRAAARRPDQDSGADARGFARDVEHPGHAIGEIHIGVAMREEERAIAGRLAAIGVTCSVADRIGFRLVKARPLACREGRPEPAPSQPDDPRRHARLDAVGRPDGQGAGRQGLSLSVAVREERQARRPADRGADAAVCARMALEGLSDSVSNTYRVSGWHCSTQSGYAAIDLTSKFFAKCPTFRKWDTSPIFLFSSGSARRGIAPLDRFALQRARQLGFRA